MKYKIAQVVGLNTDQKAALVTSLSQDRDDVFFAVLNLACDDAFTRGRQVLSEIPDYYFEADGSPAAKIQTAFNYACGKLKEFGEVYDLNISVVSGKILYLLSKGEVAVYLKRGEALSSLSAVGTKEQLISGFLQEGDRVLFATESLIAFLGEDLKKTLDLEVESFEEEVSSKISDTSQENKSLAGLFLELEQENSGAIPSIGEASEPVLPVEEEHKKPLFNITKYFPKSGRVKLFLGIGLILIILAGIGFKYKSNQEQEKLLVLSQALKQAKDDFDSAKSLKDLNPSEAKNKLKIAKDNTDKALALNPKSQEALNLKKEIEDNESSISQEFAASSFPLFLDLDLVKKNFRADKISLSGDKIVLLDPQVKTLIQIGLTKKNNQILAGSDQLGDATAVSLNGGLAFVYSEDKGILRIDTANQKLVTVSKKDADLGDIRDLYGFAGNVYLLDAKNQKIWKYLPTTEGYSDKREYLSKDTAGDFSNSLRMQIESSVYVLNKGGEILRFTKGDKDNFALSGLDKGVKDPKSFFVSSDTENLYLLDSGNSRLLVLTKTGQFKSQYRGDKFAVATDLAVDEKGKKVYLLEGSKIYSADLK